jgi:hypothetical protein
LESRLALAGDVTSVYDANGLYGPQLTLTGDNLANNFVVQGTGNPGEYRITGLSDDGTNTPTTINGQNQIIVANVSSLTIVLGGGDDEVLVKSVDLDFVGVFGGEGDDQINIGSYVPLTTPNPADNVQTISIYLNIDAGSGADTVSINYVYGASTISVAKSSSNNTEYGSLNLAIYVAFTDNLLVTNQDDHVATQIVSDSHDSISLGYVTTIDFLSVDTGDGDDLISFYACRAGASLQFRSGTGDDYVALDVNIFENGAVVDAGIGFDTIQFSRAVFVINAQQSIQLFCGLGNDTLLVGKYYDSVNGQPVLKDSGSSIYELVMDLGPGNDTATVVTNILNSFYLYMGSGDDYAYFGSNLVSQGLVSGDYNLQLGITSSGFDRIRRYNNTMDVTTINYSQVSIESTVFGPE